MSVPGPIMSRIEIPLCECCHTCGPELRNCGGRITCPLLVTIMAISKEVPDAEVEVVVCVGSINVIVTRMRKPYHYEADFERVGL